MYSPLGLTKERWNSTEEIKQWEGTVCGIEVIVTFDTTKERWTLVVFNGDDDNPYTESLPSEPTLEDLLQIVEEIGYDMLDLYNWWEERASVIRLKRIGVG